MASSDKNVSEDGNFSPKASTSKLPTDASPDSKCPICLDRFDNVSYLDPCLHRFCFLCVQEWSKNIAECPLCKQPFFSIIHTIRAEDDFKEYIVASGRPASAEGRSAQQIQEEEMINFRRALYRTGVHIHSIQDGGRYRDISAEFFRCNPACLHRLVPWLKRELTALFGAYGSLVHTVQDIIMSNVTRYDLESQAFAEVLQPFLLNRTEHFLHEFISFARCPFNLEAYDQHANYDCPAPSYDEGSHLDSSIITISPDMACSQGTDNCSSVTGLGQAPWDDETPGSSYSTSEEVQTTVASPLETSESSDEDSPTKRRRTKPPAQLQATADSNDSDSSSDSCVTVGYVKPPAERTPEVVELSSDSEESLKEEKKEDVEKEQQILCPSWSDREQSRSFSPLSPSYKEDMGSCRNRFSPAVEKTEAKKDEKGKCKVKDLSPRDLSWSPSPGSDTVCFPWSYRLSRKRKSRSPQFCSWKSRASHGHRSRREHRSKSQLKRRRSRSRESSKDRSKRSSRRSRAHATKGSLKSQRSSPSRESMPSREVSRSRSRSKGHGKRRSRSRSRDSDRYYVRDNDQSRYQWGYAFCSEKVFGDGYESSSTRTQSHTVFSWPSASPEYRIRSFVERTDSHGQRGFHERHCYCYERCRSRSRSSNRSRAPSGGSDRRKSEKPGGKRKYKTRHLENAFMESASLGREHDPKKTFSKCGDSYEDEESLSDDRASSETKRRKRKKKMRSPSVEIVYEGKAADTTRHLKKKKKSRKKHRKHHIGDSAPSPPVVITIDSDDSKEPESTKCDSSITWTGTTRINERESDPPSSFLEGMGYEDVLCVKRCLGNM
ncbi:LOW QUALITY PROTEIN: E3 ubiquitin-protein ligase Topors-like [Pterocles gutturalis]